MATFSIYNGSSKRLSHSSRCSSSRCLTVKAIHFVVTALVTCYHLGHGIAPVGSCLIEE
jgi:hypothetical protein